MAEDMVERLMLDFYASKAYDPKAARPADTVKAAIGFTIGAMSVVTPDKKRAGRRAVLSLDPENVLAEEIAIAAYLAMLNTSYPLEGSND